MADDLASHWQRAGRAIGFVVEAPCVLELAGESVRFPVRLPDFGASNGMVLADSYEMLRPHTNALMSAGYGYSTLSEPTSDVIVAEEIVELLRDWGWSGATTAPEWLGNS